MIFGLYGMNFEHMPELGWQYGYPAVLLVVLAICLALFRTFKHHGWL
jgi:magnesium transporter